PLGPAGAGPPLAPGARWGRPPPLAPGSRWGRPPALAPGSRCGRPPGPRGGRPAAPGSRCGRPPDSPADGASRTVGPDTGGSGPDGGGVAPEPAGVPGAPLRLGMLAAASLPRCGPLAAAEALDSRRLAECGPPPEPLSPVDMPADAAAEPGWRCGRPPGPAAGAAGALGVGVLGVLGAESVRIGPLTPGSTVTTMVPAEVRVTARVCMAAGWFGFGWTGAICTPWPELPLTGTIRPTGTCTVTVTPGSRAVSKVGRSRTVRPCRSASRPTTNRPTWRAVPWPGSAVQSG